MSAFTRIECDSCGTPREFRSSVSVSSAFNWHLKGDGWKTKRSAPIEYVLDRGTYRERVETYTLPLHFCPACVAKGLQKTITKVRR